jgi:sorbitol-specific phosphotransferase system component IIBC
MHPMIRSALVLFGGVVVAVMVVILMDALVARIYPLPAGFDTRNEESLRQVIAGMPTAAFVLLLTGWILAAAVGSSFATRLASQARPTHGLIVAVFVLVATIANLAAIPHPMWMWPAAIILIPAAGWIAARLVVRSAVPAAPSAVA